MIERATPSDDQGIDYFNRKHPLNSVQIRASLRVRRQIFDWFVEKIGGTEGKVFLDHGSTPDTERGDSNCFIRFLHEAHARVYAASPEDVKKLERIFPGITVENWPLEPTKMEKIDYLISSAVIEHVGSEEDQINFIANLFRFHAGVLLTTPNRSHWLEFHTKLPLIHWLPRPLHRVILNILGQSDWARESHLRVISKNELSSYIQEAARRRGMRVLVDWYSPKFLGMVSNLVVLIRPQMPTSQLPPTEPVAW
jgi:hypothetical protein